MLESDSSAQRASATWRYGVALSSVAAALIVTLLVRPDALVAPVFFLAIIVTAWIGGFGPGLVAAVLATLVIAYFFLPPTFSLRSDVAEIPHLLVSSEHVVNSKRKFKTAPRTSARATNNCMARSPSVDGPKRRCGNKQWSCKTRPNCLNLLTTPF